MNINEKYKLVGASVPEILLPKKGTDLTKFAVVACDQYSQDREYWARVEAFVGDAPSTLNMMMPEAWLGDEKKKAHEERIPFVMEKLINDGELKSVGRGLVYLERETSTGIRRGLMIALDLEAYDYLPGSKSMIRATEKTVVERLPVRIAIRERVSLEMPHVMVLVSDKKDILMKAAREAVAEETAKDAVKLTMANDVAGGNAKCPAKIVGRCSPDCAIGCSPASPSGESRSAAANNDKSPIYDFNLMEGSGRLKGWLVKDEEGLEKIADALLYLKEEAHGMLYAVGDGNHSLAAAKAHWENVKKGLTDAEKDEHPARFALVELVNLFDKGLSFEPIHRLIMGVKKDESGVSNIERDLGFDAKNAPSLQELQPKIDEWLSRHSEAEIEYIHGRDTCLELGKKPENLAITWDEFPKDSLFEDVEKNGVLVRKSFSMGKAKDKRFYLELRKIR